MRYYDIANEIRRWWDEKSILLFFGCISGFYCSLHDFNIKGNMMAAILIFKGIIPQNREGGETMEERKFGKTIVDFTSKGSIQCIAISQK